MEMVNGYVFLDLTKSNVYQKALKVLTTDKPVVVSDGSGAPYFVDSMKLDGTNVVITKGGKIITIASDNTITNVGDIQPQEKLYHYCFDANDGNITDGQLADNFYFEFVSNKKGLEDLDITDFENHLYVNAINSNYKDSNDKIVNIFIFDIYKSDDKLKISVDRDGTDNNDFVVEFTSNPISLLS